MLVERNKVFFIYSAIRHLLCFTLVEALNCAEGLPVIGQATRYCLVLEKDESIELPVSGFSPGSPKHAQRPQSLQQRRVHKHMQCHWPKLSNLHDVAVGGARAAECDAHYFSPSPCLLRRVGERRRKR